MMIRFGFVLLFLTVIFWLLFWGLPARLKSQALHQAGRILSAIALSVLILAFVLSLPH